MMKTSMIVYKVLLFLVALYFVANYPYLGIKLCPEAYLACGDACFNPSSYSCYQGQLVESSDNVCPSGQLSCDGIQYQLDYIVLWEFIYSHICPRDEGVTIDYSTKGVFENLQKEEIEVVLSFLLADTALNLTAFEVQKSPFVCAADFGTSLGSWYKHQLYPLDGTMDSRQSLSAWLPW